MLFWLKFDNKLPFFIITDALGIVAKKIKDKRKSSFAIWSVQDADEH